MSEREKFFYEIDGLGFDFEDKSIREQTGGFNDIHLNQLWEVWQAARADLLEDIELNKLADAAKTQKRVRVNLEDL